MLHSIVRTLIESESRLPSKGILHWFTMRKGALHSQVAFVENICVIFHHDGGRAMRPSWKEQTST